MQNKLVNIPNSFLQNANISPEKYQQWYRESIEHPDIFWKKQAERLHWLKPFSKVYEGDFSRGENHWFIDGKLNVSENCLDRHLAKNGDKTALIWQDEMDQEKRTFTFKELHEQVCRFANVLKKAGLKKGDLIVLYMPMVPELAVALLACTRIGVVHSVVFAGFSATALANRIVDCKPRLVITIDNAYRSGKLIPIKETVDDALKNSHNTVEKVIVVARTDFYSESKLTPNRDYWWHDLMGQNDITAECAPEACDAQDPLFILYTSGSTGKAKGIIHSTAGYLLGAHFSFWAIFDAKPNDVHWCTADIGWVTGHSYILYGPLSNGVTVFMYEGTPTYPNASRWWELVDRYKVNIFYSAPTAIRLLQREGDAFIKKYSLKTLRVLGSVGEPINPEAWQWYYENVGRSHCPIADTWWQTETGSILLTPLPGANALKPGAAMLPFFGASFALLDDDGNVITGTGTGHLCINKPWPSMMSGIIDGQKGFVNASQRFYEKYLSQFVGYYLTGDRATRDEDGNYWVIGRSDDVINVSGHRIGSAEIESALVEHPAIAEASVVGFNHPIKGEGIYAFVSPIKGHEISENLKQELSALVSKDIGKFAKPDIIQIAPNLPKTRSGKIMRRVLRCIANHQFDDLGDVSTLADPSVVEELKKGAR